MYEVIYMHTIQPRSYGGGGGGGRGYGDDSQFRLHSLARSLTRSLLPNTLARSPPRVLARCLVAGLAVASRVDTGGREATGWLATD